MTDHDQNSHDDVERLIGRSYRPDAPDPEFVARVEDRLLAAARRSRAPETTSAPRLRLLPRLAAAAAAAAVIVAVVALGSAVDGSRPPGSQTAQIPESQAREFAAQAPEGRHGLTPRELAPAPESARVEVGDVLSTGAAERRRVTLPDGSVLYVDAGSKVAVEADRRVRVDDGSVYVEVEPDPDHPFRVLTPTRELTAVGTRFAVDVDGGATSMLVTHGRVLATGVDRVVRTGERLIERDGAPLVEPAGRTSYELEWTRDLIAAAESPLVPSSDFEGGALIAMDPWGQEMRLSLRKYRVDVHIEDGFARTTIDQTYFNHAHWRLEGTFYFPLPADASLSRLAMYVAGRRMEGGMTERNRARDVFEQIVTRRKDPALLEWVDGTTFKMRVFPLEPREEKRILMSYVQRLPSLYGQATYRFPAARDLGLVNEWKFHAKVVGIDDWRCDSHELVGITDELGTIDLHAEQKGVLMDDDVVLRLSDLYAPESGATSVRSFEQDGFRYLMVRHRPDLPSQPAPAQRDWIFLVETSGSRDPVVARAQVELVREMLALAEADDRFAVVTAATRATALSDGLLRVTPANVAAAMDMLENAHLIGALDLRRALSATRPFAAAADRPVVVHVGSGVSTLGERDPGALAKIVPEGAEYVGVAVGRQWSRPFMKQAAARTGGLYAHVDPTESLRWRAFDLKATLDTPRVLDAKVVDEAEKAAFLGFEDSAAHGEEIVAVTRVPAGEAMPRSVTLAGRIAGRTWSETVSVADVQDGAGYLPRQWARLEIERLLADDAEKHRETVVELSKAMYVMSPFTSLLVLETEQMYEQFGVDRGRSDHWALYPAPDEIPVVRESQEAPRGDLPEGARDVDEILATILLRVPPYLVHSNYGNGWDWRTSYAGGTYNLRDLRQWIRSQGGQYYATDFDMELFEDEESLDRNELVDRLRESQANRRWNFWGAGRGWRDAGRPSLNLLMPSNGPVGIGGGSSGFFGWRSDADGRFALPRPVDAPFGGQAIHGLSSAFARSGSSPLLQQNGRDFSQLFRRSIAASKSIARRDQLAFGSGPAGFEMGAFAPIPSTYYGMGGGGGGGGARLAGEVLFDASSPLRLPPGLFLGSTGEVPPDSREPADPVPPMGDYLAAGLLHRITQGNLYQRLQYQRPWVNNDHRYFADLIAFAPGMNTTSADVAHVLETEGGRPVRRGTVDDGAARLIQGARVSEDWRRVELDGGVVVTFDGHGRFRAERTLAIGLREIVVCDGKTLRHLYPDLGVGAVRQMSRHHRGMLAGLAPWLLRPAADLAVGADVRLVDESTIDVVPLGQDELRMRLSFAGGKFVARRLLQGDEVLYEQEYEYAEKDVSVSERVSTKTEQSTGAYGLVAEPADAPDLAAEDPTLVVVPLPYRTYEHLHGVLKLDSMAGPKTWPEDVAMTVLGSSYGAYNHIAQQIVFDRCVRNGDTRPGLYLLLLAGGHRWDPAATWQSGNDEPVPVDPRESNPDSALAHYVAAAANRAQNSDLVLPERLRNGVFGDLAATATEIARWMSGRGNGNDRNKWREHTLDLAASMESPDLRWALLSTYWSYAGFDSNHAQRMADVLEPLTDVPGYAYHARYDRATALAYINTDAARKESIDAFLALHTTALEHGVLPVVDGNFLSALRNTDQEKWQEHWRETASTLIERGARSAVPYLGLQLQWTGDPALGDELIAQALDGCPDSLRPATTLATVEVRWTQGQYRLAESLVEGLLEEERFADSAAMWRLGAYVADAQGAVARGVLRQERALELAFDDLPDIVDLNVVRQEYGNLLARFQQLATAVEALGGDVPDSVISRIVRTADRWRALDSDPTAACHQAARILRTLGADDLAWDYLTTPLGARPNEGAPWHQLAQQLQQEGDVDLADRCFATAFEIEPTNAQFLWDRAEMLRSHGRTEAAREVWRTLADGEWQPRFQWMRDQARLRLR